MVDQPQGTIHYLKGRFLPSGAPGVAEQPLFDRKLIDTGIVDEEGKGPRHVNLLQRLPAPSELGRFVIQRQLLRNAAAKRAPNWG